MPSTDAICKERESKISENTSVARNGLFRWTSVRPESPKGTGHNKFVQRGPTLSGAGGLSNTPPVS